MFRKSVKILLLAMLTPIGLAFANVNVRNLSQFKLENLYNSEIKSGLKLTKKVSSNSLRLFHLGNPICKNYFRIEKSREGKLIGMGTIPDEYALENLKSYLTIASDIEILDFFPGAEKFKGRYKAIKNSKCWWQIAEDNWILVNNSYFFENDLLFEGFIYNNYIILKEPLYIHLSNPIIAKINAFETNHKSATIKTFEIETEDGKSLKNRFFFTSVDNKEPAFGTEAVFDFEKTTIEFAEANVFVHANAILAFFQNLGFNWGQDEPKLLLKLAETINGSPYNGLYQPDDGNGFPVISIAPGDAPGTPEGVLVGLRLDREVVMHEFGHHIIAKKLRIESRTLSLHEGLADYFTFAATGNSCLGESICGPNAGAQTCFLAETCMRTADNNITYNSTAYNNLPFHQKGQIISGLLWKLRNLQAPNEFNFDKFVLQSLNYIPINADIVDYVNALIIADEKENGSKLRCQIIDKAKSLGFEDKLVVSDCNQVEEEVPPPAEKKENKSAIEKAFGCTIGDKGQPSSIIWYMLLPFLVSFSVRRTKLRGKNCRG